MASPMLNLLVDSDLPSRFPEDSGPAERLTLIAGWLMGISDTQARFAWLVERARLQPPVPEADRRPEYLVPGCQVRLWLVPEFRHGRGWFRIDSDAVSLKAVGGLLGEYYSGLTTEEIIASRPEFLETFGLATNLAVSRRRTVWRLRELIREFAQRHQPTEGTHA